MTYLPGQRGNFARLRCTRISAYVTQIRGDDVVRWRYAFEQYGTGDRFVYTGRHQMIKEGDEIDLRGTIKATIDKYGYVRLMRIKKIQLQPELDL